MSPATIAAFEAALRETPRLRRRLELGRDRGPFVVAGHPKHWAGAADDIEAAGERVVAFHDLRLESRRLLLRGRPIWRGRRSGPLSRYRVVVAGPPRKRYFDGPPETFERCLFHAPMKPWQQNAQHTPDLLKHVEALARIWVELADDASRDVFAGLVRARADGDAGYLRVSPYREYDHPTVRARPGETVIDVGAFWGDSARRFAWQMKGRGTIVALEPSVESYRRLARQPIPGLVPLCFGAWDEHAVLRFDEAGGSSKIQEQGATTAHVAPIDDLVDDLGLERVDVIKLDVEGAERRALDGARRTLERFRPKVLLSIYHRRSDPYELPAKLRALCPDYDFYVGHHGPYHTETDLYAIPSERSR